MATLGEQEISLLAIKPYKPTLKNENLTNKFFKPKCTTRMNNPTGFFMSTLLMFYSFSTSKQLRIRFIIHRLNPGQNHKLKGRTQDAMI